MYSTARMACGRGSSSILGGENGTWAIADARGRIEPDQN